MKMLVVFEKMGTHRFVGHLDLQRAMQRALRRSGLPVVYSQGFNPHLMLSFAAPLSVGVQGERELMEVPLSTSINQEDFLQKLNAVLPAGLKAKAAVLQEDKVAPAMARLAAAEYSLVPDSNLEELGAALPGFLAQTSIPYLKKTKSGERMADLRPLIYNLRVKDNALLALLAVAEQGTAKPEQLLSCLCEFAGIPQPRCLVTRTQLLDAKMAPLEQP